MTARRPHCRDFRSAGTAVSKTSGRAFSRESGKAYALRAGAMVSQFEYLRIDGDALLHPHSVLWMMHHLTSFPRVGGGNGQSAHCEPLQYFRQNSGGEFSSIIGLIKRAQRTYTYFYSLRRNCRFSKTALDRIGYWRDDMITEDIDVSWRLQFDHWDLHYVPQALCYIYMPETFKGLWKQRGCAGRRAA